MGSAMSPKNLLVVLGLVIVLYTGNSFAQEPPALRQEQPPIPVEEIIKKFSEKEREFRIARGNYTYRQDVTMQEVNANDRVLGEYHVVSDILFDSNGKRTEKIIYAPASTLGKGASTVGLDSQDLQDIREIQPFVLTSDDIGKYNLKYLGKEKVDEVDCYVFDVAPKTIEKGQRYFQGQIWVDDQDMQIVKTYGKAVPDIRNKGDEHLFPRFETYREQIDNYWFPTYTKAVDTLQFSGGAKRVREIIKYQNYKKFQANVKLTFGDAVEGGSVDQAPSTSTDRKAPALDPRLNDSKEKKK
jgi:Outer membrane lipoprotein-sorting protein